ncbi:MAG TPA: hypothetical protein VJV78_47160 [Polyangiales bacterium]|nr:hypothetical protein [Polyangiales bacterium]
MARSTVQRIAPFAAALSLVLLGCTERPAAKPGLPPAPSAGASGAPATAAGSGGAEVVAPAPDAEVKLDAEVPSDAGPPQDAMPPHSEEDDAGEAPPPAPVCTDGVWRLAPGLLLSRKVDYVADRDTPITEDGLASDVVVVLSEAGMACARAMDRARCMAALKVPGGGGMGRHLLTSAGDSVQLWSREVAHQLLGVIDTPADALWWIGSGGSYLLPCDLKVEATKDGFRIKGALSTICGTTPNATHRPLDILVAPSGTLSDFGPIDPNDPICKFDP